MCRLKRTAFHNQTISSISMSGNLCSFVHLKALSLAWLCFESILRRAIKISYSRFHLFVKTCLFGFVQRISVSIHKFKLLLRDPLSVMIQTIMRIFVEQQKIIFNSHEVISHTEKKAISLNVFWCKIRSSVPKLKTRKLRLIAIHGISAICLIARSACNPGYCDVVSQVITSLTSK